MDTFSLVRSLAVVEIFPESLKSLMVSVSLSGLLRVAEVELISESL